MPEKARSAVAALFSHFDETIDAFKTAAKKCEDFSFERTMHLMQSGLAVFEDDIERHKDIAGGTLGIV